MHYLLFFASTELHVPPTILVRAREVFQWVALRRLSSWWKVSRKIPAVVPVHFVRVICIRAHPLNLWILWRKYLKRYEKQLLVTSLEITLNLS